MSSCFEYHVCGDSHSVEFYQAIQCDTISYKNLGGVSILDKYYEKSLRRFMAGDDQYYANINATTADKILFIHSDTQSRISLGESPDLAAYQEAVKKVLAEIQTKVSRQILFLDLHAISKFKQAEQTCSPEKRVSHRRFLNNVIKNNSSFLFYSADEDEEISDKDGFVLDESWIEDGVHYKSVELQQKIFEKAKAIFERQNG